MDAQDDLSPEDTAAISPTRAPARTAARAITGDIMNTGSIASNTELLSIDQLAASLTRMRHCAINSDCG